MPKSAIIMSVETAAWLRIKVESSIFRGSEHDRSALLTVMNYAQSIPETGCRNLGQLHAKIRLILHSLLEDLLKDMSYKLEEAGSDEITPEMDYDLQQISRLMRSLRINPGVFCRDGIWMAPPGARTVC